MARHCDRLWEIDAVREGRLLPKDAEASARHLRVCTTCSEVAAGDQSLRALAASLPHRDPGELALRRVRARILRDVAGGARRSRPAWSAVAIASACVVVLVWSTSASHPTITVPLAVHGERSSASSPVAPAFAGEVSPADGALWSQAREERREYVRLESGTLQIHVRRQAPDELFDVVLPDGTIAVRGTTFDVTAREGRTLHVHVDEGVVALRIGGAEEIVLPAGSTWPPSESREAWPTEPAAATAAPVRAPEVQGSRSDRHKQAAPSPVDDGSDAYAQAIQLFEARRFSESADAFRDFVSAHARSALAEDASFLEATALARAGRIDASGIAAEHHLQRYPESFHRKEAAILIARAARDRGDCMRATGVLAPWLAAGDKEANATLRSCAPSVP